MAYSPEIVVRPVFTRRNRDKKEASAVTEANARPVFYASQVRLAAFSSAHAP